MITIREQESVLRPLDISMRLAFLFQTQNNSLYQNRSRSHLGVSGRISHPESPIINLFGGFPNHFGAKAEKRPKTQRAELRAPAGIAFTNILYIYIYIYIYVGKKWTFQTTSQNSPPNTLGSMHAYLYVQSLACVVCSD